MAAIIWPEALYTLWCLMIAGKAVPVVAEGRLEYLSMRSKNIFKPIQSLLQFAAITSS